jgi:hypothetical protein
MPRTSYADVVTDWEQLGSSLATNITDLPNLESYRTELVGLLEQVRALAIQQGIHKANLQQASKELKEVMARGRKLATFLRAGIKHRYGNRSEKLVEFRVQPLRNRKRNPEEVPEEPAPSPKPSPSPALSEVDSL